MPSGYLLCCIAQKSKQKKLINFKVIASINRFPVEMQFCLHIICLCYRFASLICLVYFFYVLYANNASTSYRFEIEVFIYIFSFDINTEYKSKIEAQYFSQPKKSIQTVISYFLLGTKI